MLSIRFDRQLTDTFLEFFISRVIASNLVINVMEADELFIFVFRYVAFAQIDFVFLIDSVGEDNAVGGAKLIDIIRLCVQTSVEIRYPFFFLLPFQYPSRCDSKII